MAHGFQFHDEPVVDEKVGVEIAEERSILVINRERMLLLNRQPLLPQAIHQGILIDFLKVPVAMITMNGKARLANCVAQFKNAHQCFPSCVFCASSRPTKPSTRDSRGPESSRRGCCSKCPA